MQKFNLNFPAKKPIIVKIYMKYRYKIYYITMKSIRKIDSYETIEQKIVIENRNSLTTIDFA